MRFPFEILFRHRRMPLRPIRVRELRETLPELLVDFLPCGLERLFLHSQRDGLVRVRDEHTVEFRVKSFADPEQR